MTGNFNCCFHTTVANQTVGKVRVPYKVKLLIYQVLIPRTYGCSFMGVVNIFAGIHFGDCFQKSKLLYFISLVVFKATSGEFSKSTQIAAVC